MINKKKLLTFLFLLPLLMYFWPAQLYGNTNYIMLVGDSMLPTIESGTLVISQIETRYVVGDIVAFVNEDEINVIHRIVKETAEGFITRGDNNSGDDPGMISNKDILGRATFVFPYVGFLSMFLKTPLGMVIFGIFAVVMMAPKQSHKKKNSQSFVAYYAAFAVIVTNYVLTQISLGDDILFAKKIAIPFSNFFEPFLASTVSFAMLSISVMALFFIVKNMDDEPGERNPLKIIFASGALMIIVTQLLSIINIMPIFIRMVEDLVVPIFEEISLVLFKFI